MDQNNNATNPEADRRHFELCGKLDAIIELLSNIYHGKEDSLKQEARQAKALENIARMVKESCDSFDDALGKIGMVVGGLKSRLDAEGGHGNEFGREPRRRHPELDDEENDDL